MPGNQCANNVFCNSTQHLAESVQKGFLRDWSISVAMSKDYLCLHFICHLPSSSVRVCVCPKYIFGIGVCVCVSPSRVLAVFTWGLCLGGFSV